MNSYRNGLQRARFPPAIDAIKQHCDIMNGRRRRLPATDADAGPFMANAA